MRRTSRNTTSDTRTTVGTNSARRLTTTKPMGQTSWALGMQVTPRPDLTLAELFEEGGQTPRGGSEQLPPLLRGGHGGITLDAGRGVAAEELLEEHTAAALHVPPDVLARLYLLDRAHGLAHVHEL